LLWLLTQKRKPPKKETPKKWDPRHSSETGPVVANADDEKQKMMDRRFLH
jgi:hypothetical protein